MGTRVARTVQDLAERLTAFFADAGYARTEPPVLQPAGIFLDLSGEDIRRRMFVTSDAEGAEWALRPEYTIPVARAFLAGGEPSTARQSLLLRPGVPPARRRARRVRAGRHRVLRPRRPRGGGRRGAVARASRPSPSAGWSSPEIRLGDVGLFTALLDALKLPAARVRKLRAGLRAGQARRRLHRIGLANGQAVIGEHAGLLSALHGQDPAGRARLRRGPAEDRRHLRRGRPHRGRDRRALPGAGRRRGGWRHLRPRSQAVLARYRRHRRRSRRRLGAVARARGRNASSTSPRRWTASTAAPASSPRAAWT